MDKEKLGAFVQMLRKEQQMTQKELADKLCITDKAVSKWERGLSCPDISLLEPLAETLHVSVLELIQGERITSCNSISLEQAQQVLDDSLHISDKELHRKHVISKSIIILICVCLMLLVSVILNILNITKWTGENPSVPSMENPAYHTEIDSDGNLYFTDPEDATRQMLMDSHEMLPDEWNELLIILHNTLRKEEEK